MQESSEAANVNSDKVLAMKEKGMEQLKANDSNTHRINACVYVCM